MVPVFDNAFLVHVSDLCLPVKWQHLRICWCTLSSTKDFNSVLASKKIDKNFGGRFVLLTSILKMTLNCFHISH